MPFYDYICLNCEYRWEELQSIKAEPILTCPKCKQNMAKRLISGGAGVIFKGSGFYATDYKKKEDKPNPG